MKVYITETQDVSVLEHIHCDICGEDFDDTMDLQEFCSFQDTGGYSSAWGDMTTWSIDICSQCSVKMFSKFATIHGTVG